MIAATVGTTVGYDPALVVVGGSDAQGEDTADAFVLDTRTLVWTSYKPASSAAPQPAPSHGLGVWPSAVTRQGEGHVIVFGGQSGSGEDSPYLGGFWNLDLPFQAGGAGKQNWTEQVQAVFKPGQGQPQARDYFQATILEPEQSGAAGGYGPGGVAVFKCQGPQGPAATTSRVLLFGGFSGYSGGLDDKLHDDLWCVTAWEH